MNISDGVRWKKRTISPERKTTIVRMGDEPENKTGHVIVELLMTSAYAASLAFFHKAIDIVSQRGMEQGISTGNVQLPAKTSSTVDAKPSSSRSGYATDDEVFAFYRK